MLELLELIERDAGRRSVLVEFDTQLSGLKEQVTAARLVAHQDITRIAHGGRVNVLVGGGKLSDSIDVRAALVGERSRAHPRTTWIRGLVSNAIDEAGESGQTLERSGGNAAPTTLDLRDRDDGGEVAIAGAFADTVHRALHMDSTRVQRGQGISEG